MSPFVATVIKSLATLTLFGDILLIMLVLANLFSRFVKSKPLQAALSFVRENALAFAFLVASVATSGSLFFSEIAGFVPCKLCWFQRIFMYPQVIILGIALFEERRGIRKYIIPLCVIGALIAAYHYSMQFFPNLACSDELVSCARQGKPYFGFITIPFMSLSAFLLILLFMLLV